ncbi:zinc ribbon domain-containing protein [Mycobacterium barrassiae]|uniref:zinc ribbon domain-containing protein n=1 Tax=Mycobacterium barrassiae TaxID=319709 RepID=UPI002265E714|nr:zinc ribbon domain-containing protein [Mycobacterium barrassiae]MCV7300817.1 zinc ribbon domain-containing protein [Mycobacterium barrassiae]
MLECPHGHPNPDGWQLCGECGSPIEAPPEPSDGVWYRTKWAIAGAIVVVAIVLSSAAITLVVTGDRRADPSTPESAGQAAVLDWWAGAREPFVDLQRSLSKAQQALAHVDREAMDEACRQMHDSSAVDLRSHLPAPTPELTSELEAATEDAHAAAHMCMSVLARSSNSYDGEFPVDVEQAEMHLDAAQELVRQALAGTA